MTREPDTPSKRVLVLGAGELGLAIISALRDHPANPDVSVLLRPDSSSTTTIPDDIHIVSGNLQDPIKTLADILRPFEIVISASGFAGGPGSQLHIARAALHAGVEWYFPWQFGVDYDVIGRGSSQPLFDEQLSVRDLLRAQDKVKWTIVSTGLFTSFLFEPAFGVVNLDSDSTSTTGRRKATVTALGDWKNRVTVTPARDIGRLVAHVVLDPISSVDEDRADERTGVLHIASDTFTFEGLAGLLEKRGWEFTRKLASVADLQARLEAEPEEAGLRYQLVWARNRGVAWEVESSWNGRRGIPMETLETWLTSSSLL
jgi:hypothetical protein